MCPAPSQSVRVGWLKCPQTQSMCPGFKTNASMHNCCSQGFLEAWLFFLEGGGDPKRKKTQKSLAATDCLVDEHCREFMNRGSWLIINYNNGSWLIFNVCQRPWQKLSLSRQSLPPCRYFHGGCFDFCSRHFDHVQQTL